MTLNKKDIQTARDILKSSSNDLDLMMEIKKKKFRLSDLSINPRNAVHWESKGLFLNKKPEGTWQLLDLTESTWILIVQKLRDFNFKLELISDLKDNFLNARIEPSDKSSKEKIKEVIKLLNQENVESVEKIIQSKAFDEFIQSMEMSILETILMDIIHLRNHYRILFNLDGGYVLVKDDFLDHPLQDHINEYMTKSHFSLSLNEIIAELLGKIDLNLAINSYKMISQEEMQVLSILRTENIESVEIQLDKNSNTIEFINYTETIQIDAYQRLCELIMRNGYQDITIKTHKGLISHCENKVKKKIKTPKKPDQL
jgi:hypothetical protein